MAGRPVYYFTGHGAKNQIMNTKQLIEDTKTVGHPVQHIINFALPLHLLSLAGSRSRIGSVALVECGQAAAASAARLPPKHATAPRTCLTAPSSRQTLAVDVALAHVNKHNANQRHVHGGASRQVAEDLNQRHGGQRTWIAVRWT